jgi:hypothetical protein
LLKILISTVTRRGVRALELVPTQCLQQLIQTCFMLCVEDEIHSAGGGSLERVQQVKVIVGSAAQKAIDCMIEAMKAEE